VTKDTKKKTKEKKKKTRKYNDRLIAGLNEMIMCSEISVQFDSGFIYNLMGDE